jgi:hypothetical protein
MRVCASNSMENNKWLLDVSRVPLSLPVSLDGRRFLASSAARLQVELVLIRNWLMLEVSLTVPLFLPFSLTSRRSCLASPDIRNEDNNNRWATMSPTFMRKYSVMNLGENLKRVADRSYHQCWRWCGRCWWHRADFKAVACSLLCSQLPFFPCDGEGDTAEPGAFLCG